MWKAIHTVLVAAGFICSAYAQSATVQAPATVSAGEKLTVSTGGQGRATLYLIGPDHVLKRAIQMGHEQQIAGSDLTAAGRYLLVACGGQSCVNTSFQVLSSRPAKVTFFLHPSRVPVSTPNAVSGTAFVSDRYQNPVLEPAKVDFKLSLQGGAVSSRGVQAARGIAWFQMDSTARQGKLEVVASIADASEPRVIEQVASEACGLRMQASRSGPWLTLQTDPVRDCTGNPLPDGTVVSFTKVDGAGISTVDTPVKKDKATARFQISGPARITVACGAVVGNELSIGGGNP
jgi:hypothetical protein